MIKDKEALVIRLFQCIAIFLLAMLLGTAAFSQKTVYTAASVKQPEPSESGSIVQTDTDAQNDTRPSTDNAALLEPYIEKQISSKVFELQTLYSGIPVTAETDVESGDTEDTYGESGTDPESSTTYNSKIETESTDPAEHPFSYDERSLHTIVSPETEPASSTAQYSIAVNKSIPAIYYNEESENKQLLSEFDFRIGEAAGLFPLYIHEIPSTPLTWEEFKASISSTISGFSDDWGFYLKDLKTGKVISINEHPMESASLIKLYIMGTVYQHIEDGTLGKTDTITRLLDDMITVSDNEASNELVRSLSSTKDHKEGMKMVNEFIKENGFKSTRQVNGLADPSLWVEDAVNQTSPADCGKLLEKIYKGKLVSHLASRSMENLLLNQKITYKIPAGLPDGVVSANKTGEVSDTENDAAIVYSGSRDYILCIMSSDQTNTNSAVSHINSLSSMVYDYFNG